jgi:PAS domain S-box-containing protein
LVGNFTGTEDTVSGRIENGQNSPAPGSILKSLRSMAGYIAGLALPYAAIAISIRSPKLRHTPLALSFVVIAALGMYAGLGASLTAVIATALLFNYESISPAGQWSVGRDQLVQTMVILMVGLLLMALIESRRRAAEGMQRALHLLEEQADALRQAQQGSDSAAWTLDVRTGHTSWHPGGREIFGRPLEELSAMGSPTELVLEEDRPKITAAAKRTMANGEPFDVEFRVTWPNGEVHWLHASGVPVDSENQLWRGTTVDITRRKSAELMLIRAEKLAAAGRLASSIAHEINNPLAGVTNLVYLASSRATDPEQTGYLASAEEELRRLSEITSQTLRFHREQSAPVLADAGEVLAAVLALYQLRLRQSGIVVAFEREAPCCLTCHPTELRQVFSTLIRNASDAMPGGGSLRVRVRRRTEWRGGTAVVRVTIGDTGHGMPEEVRRRIYEPFYTTRGDVGTGLGLWVACGIIDRHGGSMHARSSVRPGASGTAFTLVLPLASSLAIAASSGSTP